MSIAYGGNAQEPITDFSGDVASTITYDEDFGTSFSYVATFKPTVEGVAVLKDVTINVVDASFSTIEFDIAYVGDTYEIYTGAGLKAFADIVNGKSAADDALRVSGMTLPVAKNLGANGAIKEDIDLSEICGATVGDGGTSWSPMGYDKSNYGGTFDGGNKTIKGLYMVTAETFQGFFGYTNNATIKNIKIENPYFESTGGALGAVIGRMNGVDGTITNCSVTGTTGSIVGLSSVGGIVGLVSVGDVIDCHNEGAMVRATTVPNKANVGAYARAGGVIGCVAGKSDVVGCSNAGTVYFTSHGAAGIVGYVDTPADLSVVACSNSGAILAPEGAEATGSFVGGIVGFERCETGGKIIGCSHTGKMAVASVKSFTGGIAGRVTAKTILKGNYSTGTVTTTTTAKWYNWTVGYILGGSSDAIRVGGADKDNDGIDDNYAAVNKYNYFIKHDGDASVYGDGASVGGLYAPVYADSTIKEVATVADLDTYIPQMNEMLSEAGSDYRYTAGTGSGPVLSK